MISNMNHPAGVHGRLAQNTENRVSIAGEGVVDTMCIVSCCGCSSNPARLIFFDPCGIIIIYILQFSEVMLSAAHLRIKYV